MSKSGSTGRSAGIEHKLESIVADGPIDLNWDEKPIIVSLGSRLIGAHERVGDPASARAKMSKLVVDITTDETKPPALRAESEAVPSTKLKVKFVVTWPGGTVSCLEPKRQGRSATSLEHTRIPAQNGWDQEGQNS